MEDTTNVRVTRLRRRLSVESEDTSSPLTPSTPTKRRGRPAAAKPQLDLIEENVTGLRRRLSVESEDTSSPLTPSTLTKRRGRPAAAKPQLDLIEENATATTTPRRSKKAFQDIKEQEPITPTRRSARVKSNTSETADDKPATPLKRSTRIKSNTSIISESIVNESPRTRRATRRNSVVESDNENKITPARITRRTRNESTSSVENPSDTAKMNKHKIENLIDKETNIGNVAQQISPGIKKNSPQLLNNSSDKSVSLCDQNPILLIEKLNIKNKINCKADDINDTNAVVSEVKMKTPNSKPIKELVSVINSVKKDSINYCSFLKNDNHIKKERQRTKSWTNNLDTPLNDNNFLSDNESVKKNKKIHQSFDMKLLTSLAKQSAYNDTNIPLNSSAKVNNNLSPEKISVDEADCSEQNLNLSETEQLMQSFSTKSFKPDVCIENLEPYNLHGLSIEKNMDDQCVPVVKSNMENQPSVQDKVVEIEVNIFAPKDTDLKTASSTNECFVPMDIDETISNNTSLIENKRSSMTTQYINDKGYKCVNKNEVSLQSSRIHDKNEDESTLMISEIKDISSKDNQLTSKDSQSIEKTSKSKINEIVTNSHSGCESKIFRGFEKEISLEESTDTPIKDKSSNKLSMQTSTPVTTAITTNKQLGIKTTNNSRTISDEPSSEIDSSDNESNLFDDKANEAGDDYESGDSQDEEEKKYAKENEIIGKGETLTSDDEISNDSNYEKDSFVVSSDEEDYELLSGSGENLSLSDNELKLNKKSKEEYNKRKDRERKHFSREMYEARHELNNTDKKIDRSKRRRLNSSMLESADESLIKTKKNCTSLQVDSYHESSRANSDFDKSDICNISAEKVKDPLSITLINNKSAINVDSLSTTLPSDIATLKETNDVKENIEEVHVNENVTVQIFNETRDPLQATVFDEESSLSENEEIKQSYDDVLANLNRNEKGKLKNLRLSLDLDVKANKASSKSIIDQVNVTQTKTKETKSEKELKNTDVYHQNDESSSDCIDFKLLFNEDSSGSQEINDNKENRQEFIPLKKSEGKTNLKHDIDSTINEQAVNSATPKSGKKSEFDSPKTNEEEEKADQGSSPLLNVTNEKNKKKTSNLQTDLINIQQTPKEIIDLGESLLFTTPKEGKEEKKKKLHNSQTDLTNTEQKSEETNLNEISLTKTSKSDNKKKKSSSQTELPADETINLGDFSLFKTPNSEKKKETESPAEENAEGGEMSVTKTSKRNKKKNKLSSQTELPAEETVNPGDFSLFKTPNSEKKQQTQSPAEENAEETNLNEISLTKTSKSDNKKKKSSSQTELPAEETINLGDFSLFKTPNSEKKQQTQSPAEENAEGGEMSVTKPSKRNKKKNKLSSQTELPAEETINLGDFSLFKTPNSEKKQQTQSPAEENAEGGEMSVTKTSKRNKKKNKLSSQTELPAEETINLGDFSLFKTPNSEKKQQTQSPAEENAEGGEMSVTKTSKRNKKKNKLSSQTELPAEETINLGDFSLFKTPNSEKKQQTQSPAEENENKRIDNGKRGRKTTLSNQETTSLVPVDFEQLDVKPKKRKWEMSMQDDAMSKGVLRLPSNDSLLVASKKKKQKLSTSEETTENDKINGSQSTESVNIKSPAEVTELASVITNSNKKEKKLKRKPPILSDAVNSQTNVNIKRKKRDEDCGENKTKVCKRNVTDKVHVPRLPEFILNQLDDKPIKKVQRKAEIVSTSELSAKQEKNTKPSKFLEKTVCLNDDDDYEDNIKYNKPLNIPKILPSLPFAVTSTSGSTTQFKICVLPRETKFVAQSTVSNSFNKNDYLREKQIKQKRKCYELYKHKLKSFKLSKF